MNSKEKAKTSAPKNLDSKAKEKFVYFEMAICNCLFNFLLEVKPSFPKCSQLFGLMKEFLNVQR